MGRSVTLHKTQLQLLRLCLVHICTTIIHNNNIYITRLISYRLGSLATEVVLRIYLIMRSRDDKASITWTKAMRVVKIRLQYESRDDKASIFVLHYPNESLYEHLFVMLTLGFHLMRTRPRSSPS